MRQSVQRYLVVVADRETSMVVSAPLPRDQALAQFGCRLRSGDFGPDGGRRLMVLSANDWAAQHGAVTG